MHFLKHTPFSVQLLKKKIGWLAGILVILGLSPWWSNKLLQLAVVRPDRGETADAIVVLGRGQDAVEYRTEAAVKLWQEGRAPIVFISGARDAPIIMDLAREMGMPDTHLHGEGCASSTWDNAFYTEMLMPFDRSLSAKPKIILVTDDIHIARSTFVYRNFGFEVIPYPVELKFPAWRRHVFREFAANLHYVQTDRFDSPTSKDYEHAQLVADSRIEEWQCIYSN